jgi:uncharacterized protein
MDAERALAQTRAWVEHAVIGLNLCPFAKAVQAKGLVRWVCSDARDAATLREHLRNELLHLAAVPIEEAETTLLVHPWVLGDFLDYNDFLGEADRLLRRLKLAGELQIASFHPDYRFAGTHSDDITNASNRSPHPTLHLLREVSIDRAVAAYPDADTIVQANQRTLRSLGAAGWTRLMATVSEEIPRAR